MGMSGPYYASPNLIPIPYKRLFIVRFTERGNFMNVYNVCGFFYTENAIRWLIEHEMAKKTDDGVEVWTQPIEWDRYTTPEHWNPDVADIYCLKHFGKSIQDVQRQISELGLTWVELPSIEPLDENEANHLMMLKIHSPMLPGLT